MIKRINPGSRMSAAVLHDSTVYVAGQVSADAQDVKGQTELILKKIESLLAAAGSSKSKLLSATVYLADIKTYEQMNAVWDAWVDPANSPARATVETRLAAPKYLVEITVIAAV